MKKLCVSVGVVILLLFSSDILLSQNLIAGDFIFKRIGPYRYETTARLYYDSMQVDEPDSIVFAYDGVNFDTVGIVNSLILPERNTTRLEYVSDRQFLSTGPHSIRILGVNDTLGLSADNVAYPTFSLSTILQDGVANYPPFNLSVARWDNDAIDYLIDTEGNLHWYNNGYDDDGAITYDWSNRLEFIEGLGNYIKPTANDSLLINPVTGEILWLSPSEPGKYLLGVELVELVPNTNSPLNYFSRYLVVEIKPEDIVSSATAEPVPAERVLTLFPNPARERVRIALPPALASGPTELTIYNVAGARVYRRSFAAPPEGEVLTIATRGWPAGVYSVAWRVGQGMYTARLVVDR